MQQSRALLLAIPTKTPRRRVRSPPVLSNLPPSRDLIGPPCPLSNLRPVYYAPLFPSLHNPSTWSTSFASSTPAADASTARPANPHPYSLSEFPSSSLSRSPKQQRLFQLKQKLHSQDLEYRLARYRFDNFNQDFWVRMNTQFLESRDRYVASNPTTTSTNPDGVAGTVGLGNTEDVDLAPFYAQHLARTKKAYQEYNTKLWRMQAKLIGLAIRDVFRRARWNCAIWWAGGEK